MTEGSWTCTATIPLHPVLLEHLETLPRRGSAIDGIERCRTCGARYWHRSTEVNDWGENGDYYSRTEIWTPVTPAEVDRLREDRAYQPAAEPAHRWDSGWRAC